MLPDCLSVLRYKSHDFTKAKEARRASFALSKGDNLYDCSTNWRAIYQARIPVAIAIALSAKITFCNPK